jgi:hypothetical protein
VGGREREREGREEEREVGVRGWGRRDTARKGGEVIPPKRVSPQKKPILEMCSADENCRHLQSQKFYLL